jgi:DNA repair protein RecO (recombination protein O)
MEWRDEGIVLAVRPYGESAALVSLLTRAHGRHAGLARGGAGRRGRALYQTGNQVQAVWRARLNEHLGSFACELVAAHGGRLIDDPPRLAALTAAAALAEAALPEREPHAPVFDRLLQVIAVLEEDEAVRHWPEQYVRWELALLADLGFGLDLAAAETAEGLAFVSPRTGRAVSAEAGARYRDRLLVLPPFLGGTGAPAPEDVLHGLKLTGHFLERHLLQAPGGLPAARRRLHNLLERRCRAAARGHPAEPGAPA